MLLELHRLSAGRRNTNVYDCICHAYIISTKRIIISIWDPAEDTSDGHRALHHVQGVENIQDSVSDLRLQLCMIIWTSADNQSPFQLLSPPCLTRLYQ